MSNLKRFDEFLKQDGPVALVLRQHLMPVEGQDGVVFPATYAAGGNFPGGYNIDSFENKTNVALIDSIGSQANRIEPIFAEEDYKHLIPQISVTVGVKQISILEAGHRAGDAIVRCSSLAPTLQDAFKAVLSGSAEPIAKIAPTSLVFGVWDSRDTQVKLPRVFASTIRAFEVRRLTRSAQYNPPIDYSTLEVFSEEEKAKAEGDTKNPLAKRGFVHVPAIGSHGGVIADGGIRRDATLSLAALRLLHVGNDQDRTLALRRYILGLSLIAITYPPAGYLRQGCLLVLNPSKANENEFVEVQSSGERKPCNLTHDEAKKYATEAAIAFGVGPSQTVPFEKERAKRDVSGVAAENGMIDGKITKVESESITIKRGKKDTPVTVGSETKYFLGDAESNYELVVVKGKSVEAEVANGVAVKITSK